MAEDKPAAEQEQQPQPKANGADTVVIQLRKKIIANGEEVSELRFREPTGGDIERVGTNPVQMDFSGGETPNLKFDAKAMTQMMSLLAAVPPSAIRQMHPKDWNWAAWQLGGFFVPDL